MKILLVLLSVGWLAVSCPVAAQQPNAETWLEPAVVAAPKELGQPPADAVVLLAATDLSAFDGGQDWRKGDGFVSVSGKKRLVDSKQAFGDCQLHVEFATPPEGKGSGQHRGNSGLYLMGLYEVQVLDSFNSKTYPDGQCGSLYRQSPPAVNVCRGPGKWQMYDIAFKAPRFANDGSLHAPASVTVFHNGVLIQNQKEFKGPTDLREETKYTAHASKLPLRIQNHGNPVRYRNIWVRENVVAAKSGGDSVLSKNEPAGSRQPRVVQVKSAALSTAKASESEWEPLLDSQLSRWEKFLGVPHPSVKGLPEGTLTSENFKEGTTIGVGNDFLNVFTVDSNSEEPVVRISGEVYGALTSKDEYSNYRLKLQFKWGDKKFIPRIKLPKDSGLLYHCVGHQGAYASSWMTSVECQIMEKDYGDLFCLGDASAKVLVNDVAENTRPVFTPTGNLKRLKVARRMKDYGHPTEWNTAEVLTVGNDAIHVINGHVANVVKDARLGMDDSGKVMDAGKIQIQSEGAELFVRRIMIQPLTDFPAELLQQVGLNKQLEFVGDQRSEVKAAASVR